MFFNDSFIIFFSIIVIESAASDSTSDNSIVPFVFWMIGKDSSIIRVLILRNDQLSSKSKSHDHSKLENALTNDVFKHSF